MTDRLPSDSLPPGGDAAAALSPDAFPAPPTAPPTRSWGGVWAAAGVVILGAALLVGVFVPWWLSNPARVTAWVARNAPNLHGRVEMAKARFTWLGPIVFEDVVVVPANGAREPVVIQRIAASHGILAFLGTGGDVGHVSVEGLEAHIVFDEDRTSNAAGLFVDPSDPDEGRRPPQKTPLRMALDVVDARVRIEGPWSPTPWISDPIDVSLRLAHTPAGDASEWTLQSTTILEGAELEPSVAQGVLAYIAPVMADATRTSGRFSLALDGGTFPVGAPEQSTFSGTLTMHAVDLGPGPLVTHLLAALPGSIQVPTSIRIADDSRIGFRMAERRMWHEGLRFGFPLPRGGSRLDLASRGSVGLDDKSLDIKLALPIPTDLPAERPILASLAGKTVSIGIGGRLGEPRIDFDGSLRGAAAGVIAATIDRLFSKPTATPVAEPAPQQPSTPAAPRPGWFPGQAGSADGGEGVAADGASDRPEMIPAPPPRPGWSPIKRPGLGPQAGEAFAPGNPGSAATPPPGGFAADVDARSLGAGAAASPDGQPARGGTAQGIDALKDWLAPQVADSPQTDRVIDLVGGLIDEVARRRAQRAALEGANGAQPGQAAAPSGEGTSAPVDPAAGGPRRGRLLRRLFQPDQPSSAPPSGPATAPLAPTQP